KSTTRGISFEVSERIAIDPFSPFIDQSPDARHVTRAFRSFSVESGQTKSAERTPAAYIAAARVRSDVQETRIRCMAIAIVVLLGVAVLAHTAPFPFVFEAFRPSRSLWHVAPKPGGPPTLYLTFDDGPNPDWTPVLLDALAEAGIHATFFLIDEHITPETEA